MAADASVLMLDEPTSGLSRDFIDRILIRGSAKRRRQRAKSLAAN